VSACQVSLHGPTSNQADLREDALGRGGLPVAARAMSFVSLSPARVFCARVRRHNCVVLMVIQLPSGESKPPRPKKHVTRRLDRLESDDESPVESSSTLVSGHVL
jgi:hypothetical protein